MPELTRKVVNLYIESAEAFATSQSERKLIRLALDLNSVSDGREILTLKPPKRMYKKSGGGVGASGEWSVSRRRVRSKKGFYVGDISGSAEIQVKRKAPLGLDLSSRSWLDLVQKEIHTALCTRSVRYRKYVEEIDHNFNLLIGVIAVAVAGRIGLAVTVVASLVASLMRLIVSMGVKVFCERYASG